MWVKLRLALFWLRSKDIKFLFHKKKTNILDFSGFLPTILPFHLKRTYTQSLDAYRKYFSNGLRVGENDVYVCVVCIELD